jgi:hypothetical protein
MGKREEKRRGEEMEERGGEGRSWLQAALGSCIM